MAYSNAFTDNLHIYGVKGKAHLPRMATPRCKSGTVSPVASPREQVPEVVSGAEISSPGLMVGSCRTWSHSLVL